MSLVEVTRGGRPLVLGLPHTGTELPDGTGDGLNDTGRALADTDWHIHRLYAGLVDGVSTVRTRVHRYVIDANRDPGGVDLYPGQNTTGLCPLTDFDGQPLYHARQEPDTDEVARRVAEYHAPYHAALRAELERVRTRHGFVILYDCHSIRSRVPFLFDGVLPDFNIGTDGTTTCDPRIESTVCNLCERADGYGMVPNGRFRGGWTTRHYGRPADGQHAIQMELAQSTYMQEAAPWRYDPDRADGIRLHLGKILTALLDWRPE